jgi:hypothetical protein
MITGTIRPANIRRRDIQSGFDTCSLALVADHLFFASKGSDYAQTAEAMISYVDYVDAK